MFFSLCIALIIGLYIGRSVLLRRYVNGKVKQTEQKYGLTLTYRTLSMPDINTVEIKEVTVIPTDRDTLLTLGSFQAEFSFWELLKANIHVKRVTSDDIAISFIKRRGVSNYDCLFEKEKVQQTSRVKETDFGKHASKILKLAFGFLPGNGEIQNFSIRIQRDSDYTEVNMPRLRITDHHFSSLITVRENGQENTWNTKGILQNKTKTIEATLFGKAGKISIPYINKYYGAQVVFDTLSFQLTQTQEKENEISLIGKAEVKGLKVFHKSLSAETINLDNGSLDYIVAIGKNFIELDSATTIAFNWLKFNPYIRAQRQEKWHITASVNKPWFPANELFSSLPKGLFGNLEGIKTEGNLSYHFLLDIDFNRLDSIKLESELKGKDFRISGYGHTDLRKMNEEFLYTAYEQGNPVRSFAVGPSNPHFCPLDSISPLLQMSVLQSEDGAFFYHQGFLIDAMREALIHDLKVKRFARGGSTITMQLIKNVFLNRNKNIARKLEEVLLVWLIETEHITSKQRMFEVYMNIIEWGPLIYGINEAAEFYFLKKPSQLTTNEAIFLASIIPGPKRFRSSFNENMTLKESLGEYYRLIAQRLLKKGLISEEDAENIRPEIKIAGDTRQYFILTPDSIQNR